MVNYNKQTTNRSNYQLIAVIAALFALCVIMLGAYTRLSDAGLGCPDWPGCYGKMVLPQTQHGLAKAQTTFPKIAIEPAKAWKEMIHRYFAGTLGLLILVLAIAAVVRRRKDFNQPLFVPILLVALVGFQAVLGMWTVTWKLLPLVVMGHLIGGMTIVSLLWWLSLSTKSNQLYATPAVAKLRPWAIIGTLIIITQIFLGAWTSTNYAALACPNFPFCQGTLFPHMLWAQAFNFTHPVGPNYEGGHLEMGARVTIQMAHRYGAFITTAFTVPFALCLMLKRSLSSLRGLGWALLIVLAAQVTLGILNVELLLPMWTAVAHNGMAAIFLMTMVTIVYRVFNSPKEGLV